MSATWPPPPPPIESVDAPPASFGERHSVSSPLPPPPPPSLLAAPPWMYPPTTPAPPFATLPARAAVTAAVVTVVVLTINRIVILALADLDWPVAAYLALSALIAYGPLVGLCFWICARWGSGSLPDDLGLRFRPVDLGWGVLTWLTSLVVQAVLAVIITTSGVPFQSNTEGIEAGSADKGYVIALLLLAVVAAPIVEELVFRGVVLRGAASRVPPVAAVLLQGVCFGAVHIDPTYGWRNIGLVLVLSGVGCVLGGTAVLVRRLAPTMVAHAILNGVALTIVLSGVLDR